MLNKSLLRKLVLIAVAFQLLVLIVMAAKREWIISNGQQIYLRTAPIDPRDPFRGDFVRLRYNFNQFFKEQYQGQTPFEQLRRGQVIYGRLKQSSDDIFIVNQFTDHPTSSALHLKGRITTHRYSGHNTQYHKIKFGIEQYFVQQGKGKEIEARLGSRNTLQVPMEIKVAVGKDSTAVITGHRWSRLGMQLLFERVTPRAEAGEKQVNIISPLIKILLQNVSDSPLRLPTYGSDCDFRLLEANLQSNKINIDRGCTEEATNDIDVVSLKPGDTYTVKIDMSTPRWRITDKEGIERQMGERATHMRYRLRYTAPALEDSWQGFLDTPAFRPTGNID